MHTIRYSLLALLLATLSACGLADLGNRPVSNLYCDTFLVYDMCAEDLNRDGVVEFVYFPDSMDVFMYRDGVQDDIPVRYGLHRCAISMDPELVDITSRVFYVTDETPYLEKQDIRGAMMIKYIAYMPRVATCQMQQEQAVAAESVR